MKKHFFSCLLILLVNINTLLAQDSLAVCSASCLCNKEIATPPGVMFGHSHKKGEGMLSYRLTNASMHGIYSGSMAISDSLVFTKYLMAPENMNMNMHMLMAMFGISNRLTIMFATSFNTTKMGMLHYVSGEKHEHDHSSEEAESQHLHSMGFGDVKLSVLYTLWNDSHFKLLLNGGLSLPTGKIDLSGSEEGMMYVNQRMPYAMQQGSGTVDVLPGFTSLFQQKRYVFGVQCNAILRTGKNKLNYSLGDELTSTIWWACRWGNFFSSSLRAEGVFCERIKGKDQSLYLFNEPATNPNNYGGQKVLVHLGSTWQPPSGTFKKTKIGVEFGLPVYQFVHGIQSPQHYVINTYLSINI